MEMSVSQVAGCAGLTTRAVQQALAAGQLCGHRRVGRSIIVDDVAVNAWQRSVGRGRTWTVETRDAALDLLSGGQTDKLSASERSRLRARLRQMDARRISHAAGGLGVWARYRGTVDRHITKVGPSAVEAGSLGLVAGGGWLTFIQVPDLGSFELQHDATLDPDGNLGMLERQTVDNRIALLLLDTYLLGDARESSAAAIELQRRARAL